MNQLFCEIYELRVFTIHSLSITEDNHELIKECQELAKHTINCQYCKRPPRCIILDALIQAISKPTPIFMKQPNYCTKIYNHIEQCEFCIRTLQNVYRLVHKPLESELSG